MKPDRESPIIAEDVHQAAQNIIVRRETHLENLEQLLQEDQIRQVVEPMLMGDSLQNVNQKSLEYAERCGIIKNTETGFTIANAIYREVIPRVISQNSQLQNLTSSIKS